MFLLPLCTRTRSRSTPRAPTSLHDALPISPLEYKVNINTIADFTCTVRTEAINAFFGDEMMHESGCARNSLPVKERSEEHTSELQSLRHLVCRLLLEQKKGSYNERGAGSSR